MYLKLPIMLLALIEGSLLVFATYFSAALYLDGLSVGYVTGIGSLLPAALFYAAAGLVSLFAVGLYSTRQRSNTAGILVRIVAAMTGAVGASRVVY